MPTYHHSNRSVSRRSVAALLFCGFGLFLLSGCGLLATGESLYGQQALPTLAPTAALPELLGAAGPRAGPNAARLVDMGTVPATYTAVAGGVPASGIATVEGTIRPLTTMQPTFQAAPSPTPALLAAGLLQPSIVPYLDQPPQRVACDGRGTVFRSRFPSQVGGRWRSYHVYLPPCYGQDNRAYPLLYLIHGSIQTDSHWLDLGLAAYADSGIRSGRYPPFVAIMPFSGQLGNISSGGDNSIEGITVNNLLPHVDRSFCTWSSATGRSIGGISRGGYWALEIAFRYPVLFGAVAGHSSHLRFETDPARYNPLATYASADLSRMRIWLDRGEKDFLRVGQDRLHQLLTNAGIVHEYRVNPGGHNEAYWAAHLAEYLDWHTSAWPREREAYPFCN